MLTRKQSELLRFIHERLKRRRAPLLRRNEGRARPPSKSGIHRLIMALEERGFIRRPAQSARALEVLRMPNPRRLPARARAAPLSASSKAISASPGRFPWTPPITGNQSPSRSWAESPRERDLRAADEVPFPSPSRRPPVQTGDHYALEVRGDSMIEAGILDGDTVCHQEAGHRQSGDIVVA